MPQFATCVSSSPDAVGVWSKAERTPVSGRPDVELGSPKGLPWLGWGGCVNELGWRALEHLEPAAAAKLQDLWHAPNGEGCRFSLIRVPIGASDFAESWYSNDEHPGDLDLHHFSIQRDRLCLIPFLHEALRRQPKLKVVASPWSPPTWMKQPAVCNYGRLRPEPAIRTAYARYLLEFVRRYRQEGIPVSQLHLQNEPDSDQKFPSCCWTGEELAAFIRDHLGPLFRKESEPCELWLGTLERPCYNRWAGPALDDPETRGLIAGLGVQWAGRGLVLPTRLAHPELPILQTENECGDGRNDWEHAHHVFDLLWHYITNGANGYLYWNLVLPKGGRSTWGWSQNSLVTVDPQERRFVLNPEYYVIWQASRFVPQGSRALEISGPWAPNALAFECPDKARILLVRNPKARAQSLEVAVGLDRHCFSLPPRSFNTLLFPSRP